jgi:hypothetical protein
VLTLLLVIWLYPVSTRVTRTASVVLLTVVWFGLILIAWRVRPLRYLLLAVTGIATVFLSLPAREAPAANALRADYVAGLLRYDGVKYYWGGESPLGIDCSGLIRRGLTDSLIARGVSSLDPGLVRRGLWLWWNDCSARALGDNWRGVTIPLLAAPSINELDHSHLLPGDLAVTSNGLHVMAYLGDRRWIEADPEVLRVITVEAPAKENIWFDTPMDIVRWKLLAE